MCNQDYDKEKEIWEETLSKCTLKYYDKEQEIGQERLDNVKLNEEICRKKIDQEKKVWQKDKQSLQEKLEEKLELLEAKLEKKHVEEKKALQKDKKLLQGKIDNWETCWNTKSTFSKIDVGHYQVMLIFWTSAFSGHYFFLLSATHGRQRIYTKLGKEKHVLRERIE